MVNRVKGCAAPFTTFHLSSDSVRYLPSYILFLNDVKPLRGDAYECRWRVVKGGEGLTPTLFPLISLIFSDLYRKGEGWRVFGDILSYCQSLVNMLLKITILLQKPSDGDQKPSYVHQKSSDEHQKPSDEKCQVGRLFYLLAVSWPWLFGTPFPSSSFFRFIRSLVSISVLLLCSLTSCNFFIICFSIS